MPTKPHALEERLTSHPELKQHLLELLELAESDIDSADRIEELMVEGIQAFGRQAIQDWAQRKEGNKSQALRQEEKSASPNGKKILSWTTTVGVIEIEEQTFKLAGTIQRPFCAAAGVRNRAYSLLMQRRITDFGAEKSFARAAQQVVEHYGIVVPIGAIRRITEQHGDELQGKSDLVQGETSKQAASQLIAEVDGTMIPLVTVAEDSSGDKRKTREVCWNEARLGLVYEQGCTDPIFGATTGSVDQAGDQLALCASRIGMNAQTEIHGVGDGAPWIASQMERLFGAKGSYLIDFYHLCDYLAAASKSCAKDHEGWLAIQKKRMKSDQFENVLAELTIHQEPSSVADKGAPVRACLRYLKNRPDQFNYAKALREELPIGSGKIESAHRYVIQERLKISGAWWKIENADKMLALRLTRANGNWEKYWDSIQAAR